MNVANKNTFNFTGGFNITAEELVDSRTSVATVADLTKAETWEGMRMPNDIRVTVHEDSSVWVLKDNTKINILAEGWVCVGYSEKKIRDFAKFEAKEAIKFVVSGASSAFDTLQEVEEYLKNHSGETIDIIEDINSLSASVQTINSGLVNLNYDEKGAAEQALKDAKQYTDDEIKKLSASTTIADLQQQIDDISNLIGFIDAPGHVVIIRPDDNWTITFENTTGTGGEIDTPDDPIVNPVEEIPTLDLTLPPLESYPYNKEVNSGYIDIINLASFNGSQLINNVNVEDDTPCNYAISSTGLSNTTQITVNVEGYKPVTYNYEGVYATVYLAPIDGEAESTVSQSDYSFDSFGNAKPLSTSTALPNTGNEGVLIEGDSGSVENNELIGEIDDNTGTILPPIDSEIGLPIVPEIKYAYGLVYLTSSSQSRFIKVTVIENGAPVGKFTVHGKDATDTIQTVQTSSSGTCGVQFNMPVRVYIDSESSSYQTQSKYINLNSGDITLTRELKDGPINTGATLIYGASFYVVNSTFNPIEGARIVCTGTFSDSTNNERIVHTNSEGEATIAGCIGDINYVITAEDYQSATGVLNNTVIGRNPRVVLQSVQSGTNSSHNRMDVAEKLKDFICDETNIDREDITNDSIIANLGVDSNSMLNIIIMVEEKYDIEIPDSDFPSYSTLTFEDFLNIVMNRLD